MASTYEPISSTTLSSSNSSISIGSIPATYTDLRIVAYLSATSSSVNNLFRVNGLTTAVYNYQTLQSNGGSASAALTNGATSVSTVEVPVSPERAIVTVDLFNYASAVRKGGLLTFAYASGTTSRFILNHAFSVNTVDAISSISFTVSNVSYPFTSGSIVTVFGIKAA